MLWLRFQISAASQSSHPDWVVAKIYLQREHYTWDGTSHEHSVLLPVHPWNPSVAAERGTEWCQLSEVRILRAEESHRAQSCCCNRGSAAQEWHCWPVTLSSSSAAELYLRMHPSTNLKWLYSHFARKKYKGFYRFYSVGENRLRKVMDKEMLIVPLRNADSAFGEQPDNK